MSHPAARAQRARRLVSCATVVLAAAAIGSPAAAATPKGTVARAGGTTAIPGSYIVVLSNTAVAANSVGITAQNLAAQYGGTVERTYQHALRGFAAKLSPAAAANLAANRSVRSVEQDHTVTIDTTQSPTPSWGLDRIDQKALPLDNSYTYPTTASAVKAYVIDTGIRFTHQDFGGRAVSGRDTVDNDNDATDCHGHGTHVSGTLGGSSYGVAKGVNLVGVRVLDCDGSGTIAGVIAGIDWVTGDHAAGQPAVANMSLGGGYDQTLNDAVTNSIADGVTYAIAAGNSTTDACDFSPASTPNAITVGATDNNDARAYFSNYGTCLDTFAPGVNITSAWATGDTATNTISGTSMASPHTAGVAALILATHPTFTPQQVRDKLVTDATPNVVTSPGSGSPNRLLHVRQNDDDFAIGLTPTTGTVDPGASTAATVTTSTTSGKAQTVNLSASGLPTDATATFNPTSITSGESSALTITTSPSTPPGVYTITITGTGPSTTNTTTFTLKINGNNFAVGLSAASAPVHQGGSASTTVISATTAGDAQTINLSASGLPTDATATFNPTSITTGESSALTITTSASTPPGVYTITITGTGTNASRTATFVLTVDAPCNATNDTDVPIKPHPTARSTITISGCPGNGSEISTVEVHIVHQYRLTLWLTAPDGFNYLLDSRFGTVGENVDKTYTVYLRNQPRNGTWRLNAYDTSASDTYLDSWSISL